METGIQIRLSLRQAMVTSLIYPMTTATSTHLRHSHDHDPSSLVSSLESERMSLNESYYDYEHVWDREELKDMVSATSDVPIEYTMVLWGYLMPFLLLLTIIANTLIVVVLSRKHMVTPTNIVLLAMAISDLLTMMFPAPWYFYMYTLGHHSRVLSPTYACYAFHVMIEVIPAFFHTASIWLTLLLAMQRYVYVCHPTHALTWCTGQSLIDLCLPVRTGMDR